MVTAHVCGLHLRQNRLGWPITLQIVPQHARQNLPGHAGSQGILLGPLRVGLHRSAPTSGT